MTQQELDQLREQVAQEQEVAGIPAPRLNEMNALIAKLADLRDKEKAASEAKSAIVQEVERTEALIAEYLLEAGIQNYRAPAGLATLAFRTSVKTPKTPEQKAAFYQHLKDKGRFEEMISVNSQTLNSYWKEEFQIAQEEGREDFSIPGVTEITTTPTLSFRRTR